MAKAIYGHTGADARLAAEIARLRARVRDLEAEVERLSAVAVLSDVAVLPEDEWAVPDWVVPAELLVPDPR
jgi:hypothetical protein